MTRKQWLKLKKGSVIRGKGERGSKRRVLYYSPLSQTITLDKLFGGGRTVYCVGDKLQFDLLRY